MLSRVLGCLVMMLALWSPLSGALAKNMPIDAQYVHRQGATTLPELFAEQLSRAKKEGKEVIVMFTADWCAPCKSVKEFLAESKEVQKAVAKGKFLFIDVDEWRGPAHQLIAGVNPQQLPVLARVDHDGKLVRQCFGTDLGLISDQAVATNLARLLRGEAPERLPALNDPNQQRTLIVEQAQRANARVKGIPTHEVKVLAKRDLGGGLTEWTVSVFIQNHDSRRRFFAIPTELGVQLEGSAQVESWEMLRFTEHVRAFWYRFEASPAFFVVPLGGHGSVRLGKLVLRGRKGTQTLEIAELDSLTIGGTGIEFDKKVPFVLEVKEPGATQRLGQLGGSAEVAMPVAKRYVATLK
jgi:thiol-disulfide isomerase/thioredoxin